MSMISLWNWTCKAGQFWHTAASHSGLFSCGFGYSSWKSVCMWCVHTCIERLLWWTYGSAIYQAYRSIAVMDLTCSLIESIRKEGWYTWTCLTTPAITLTIKNRCFEVDSLFHEEIMLFKFSIQTYSINEDKVRW